MGPWKKVLLFAAGVFLLCMPGLVSAGQKCRVAHVYVALCDNVAQGIVPVPGKLGNGDDPSSNLYWGALYGVKTFFAKSADWRLAMTVRLSGPVLERCVFKRRKDDVYLVADAYRGKRIRRATVDFLNAASGNSEGVLAVETDGGTVELKIHGGADLVAYVGHDGLMDFELESYPSNKDGRVRDAIVLACRSRDFFHDAIVAAGAKPLVWTTGLMAPEAYTLDGALSGWALGESDANIVDRAARAYGKYQNCGLKAAKRLLVGGMAR